MRISWGYWNDFCDRLPIGEINREIDANFGIGTLERDVFRRVIIPLMLCAARDLFRKPVPTFRDHALGFLLRVIFSENRCPLFGITR